MDYKNASLGCRRPAAAQAKGKGSSAKRALCSGRQRGCLRRPKGAALWKPN